MGGEINTTERGKFARVSVELDLEKKLVPKIKIRNRTYLIEYEGLNLICFNCGRYGHHKEICTLRNESEHKQYPEVDENRHSHNNSKMNKDGSHGQQVTEEHTFGSWMVVKRNTRNKNVNKQQINGEWGRRMERVDANNSKPDSQMIPFAGGSCGSCFTLIEVEEEVSEDIQVEAEQSEPIGDNGNATIDNLENRTNMSVNKDEEWQASERIITEPQKKFMQTTKHGTSVDLLKGKSIVERFVKPTRGIRNKTAGLLKRSPSSSFKPQKLKKGPNQWDK